MSTGPANAEIVDFLNRHGALMELNGDNPFRVRAMVNAARMIEELGVDAAAMAAGGTLREVEGIGKGVEELVTEFVHTGSSRAHEALKRKIPEGLLDILRIPGLGTRKVKALHDGAGIESVEELETACRDGRLDRLNGFGAKTRENILAAIGRLREFGQSWLLHEAAVQAGELCEALRTLPETTRAGIAGSLRRSKETVKDIDLVAASDDPAAVSAAFARHPMVREVTAWGDTKTSVRLHSGIQADLRIVSHDRFPALLHHFTGSRDHNVAMRSRALARGMRLNEYGLFSGSGEEVPCREEAELFAALGLDYIPPELREGLGEIEAAAEGTLPELIRPGEIRGMLHVHTSYSDGRETVAEMAAGARGRGYSYLGICDHSQSAGYVFGLKPEEVAAQHLEIDEVNETLEDFRVFKGIESDIRGDGSLDYDDELLAAFDFVVAAVHNGMSMDEATQTERVIRAIEHPATRILAHPEGRILNQRQGWEIDMEAVIEAAAENDVALELNAQPNRLDLDWRWVRKAREKGVRIAINTDAHRIAHLDYIALGVSLGRKGWLEAGDVINSLEADAIADLWSRSRD